MAEGGAKDICAVSDVSETSTPKNAPKRRKFTGITVGDKVWDPSSSKFCSARKTTPLSSTPVQNVNLERPVGSESVSSIESVEGSQEHYSGLTTDPSDVEFLLEASKNASPGGHSDLAQGELSSQGENVVMLNSAIDTVDANLA